jgi:tetratricopeptide (TPR) repeat protein
MWIFRLLGAIILPLLFFAILEFALRIGGFGYPAGFLLASERDGQAVLVQNNRFGWRFFGASMARTPQPICLPAVKEAQTVRIVVFGESAAQGDPQPNFGLSRMLEALLELRHPGTHFEIVNSGITAINSNVILPIAQDCNALNADIWVIYMGNNEVVGPFGAGTVFGQQALPLPMIRANVALKSTRVGQLLDALLGAIQRGGGKDKGEWGGMEMFLNQQVSADDARMRAVYDHFARNLSDIIETGRHHGSGIVVSTVAVNLKDCAPFASAHRKGLTDTDRQKWEAFYRNGVAAQAANRMEEAAGFFQDAAQVDDHFAELCFRQGCCALALGKTAEAQKQFAVARDEDTLRFRCDSRLNDLIRQTAAHYGDRQVVLADAEQTFAQHSADGLPGDNWFYEHVHLTFDGNYLLARALAPEVETLLPKQVTASVSAGQPWPSEADCAQRLAWSDRDQYEAYSDILYRLSKPPFTAQITHGGEVARFRTALQKVIPATQPEGIQQAESLCESALGEAPDDPLLRAQLGALEQSAGDLAGAAFNTERAATLLPSSSDDWSQLGMILAKQQNYDQAATAFRRAFQLNPGDVFALQNIAQSLENLGRIDEAMTEYRHVLAVNPRFGLAWIGMGQILAKSGRTNEAEEYYHRALVNRIYHGPELATLARFCDKHGWHEAAATNYDDALALNPGDAMLYVEAGQNLENLGRHAEAERHFAAATKVAPNLMQAHYLYGLALGRAGDPAGAAEQFREVIRIMPDLKEARLNLGLALENGGDYAGALREFNQVLEQEPANAMALSHSQALRQKLAAGQGH